MRGWDGELQAVNRRAIKATVIICFFKLFLHSYIYPTHINTYHLISKIQLRSLCIRSLTYAKVMTWLIFLV